MLDSCLNILGADADAFDLHEWFFAIDKMAVDSGLLIPRVAAGAARRRSAAPAASCGVDAVVASDMRRRHAQRQPAEHAQREPLRAAPPAPSREQQWHVECDACDDTG